METKDDKKEKKQEGLHVKELEEIRMREREKKGQVSGVVTEMHQPSESSSIIATLLVFCHRKSLVTSNCTLPY